MTIATNGAQLLVECLEAQGVDCVFGIPGAKVDAVFEAMAERGMRLVLCRHEQNAAFMAGMHGLLTGRPGVCLVTSGPGVTNLVTGLSTATYDSLPVVALGGNVRRGQRHIKTHQSLDNVGVMKPVTKYSVEVLDGDSLPEILVNAFRVSGTPPLGATFISLPQDVLVGPARATPLAARPATTAGAASAAGLQAAARLIAQARMPVLFAGAHASQPEATRAIRALLARCPMPTVNTYQAAGVLSRELYNCFAGSLGIFRNQPGDRLLQQSDLVLAVGFDAAEYDPELWNRDRAGDLIDLNVFPAAVDRHYQPTLELMGDIAANLEALTGLLAPQAADPTANPLVMEVQEALLEAKVQGARESGFPIHPLRIIHELRRLLDDDTTVLCDIGSIYVWMARYFQSYEPRRLHFSNGQQTLGVGLPWAIAACLARPGERVVSLSGDGGFLFSAMELETAVRERCNLVHLVWRDGAYDMVKIQQILKYNRPFGVEFGPVDIVRYAEAFGATGLRIDSADRIGAVLTQAMNTPGPVLVDVPIDYRHNQQLCAAMHEHAGL